MKTVTLPGKTTRVGVRLSATTCAPKAQVVNSGFGRTATWEELSSNAGLLNIKMGAAGTADIFITMGDCSYVVTVMVSRSCCS